MLYRGAAVWNVVNRETVGWESQNSVNSGTLEFNNSKFFLLSIVYIIILVFGKPPLLASPILVVCNTDQAACMAEVLFCRLSAEPEVK